MCSRWKSNQITIAANASDHNSIAFHIDSSTKQPSTCKLYASLHSSRWKKRERNPQIHAIKKGRKRVPKSTPHPSTKGKKERTGGRKSQIHATSIKESKIRRLLPSSHNGKIQQRGRAPSWGQSDLVKQQRRRDSKWLLTTMGAALWQAAAGASRDGNGCRLRRLCVESDTTVAVAASCSLITRGLQF